MCVCVPDLCVTTAKIFMWEIREHLGIGKPITIGMMYTESSGTAADFYEPEIFQLS